MSAPGELFPDPSSEAHPVTLCILSLCCFLWNPSISDICCLSVSFHLFTSALSAPLGYKLREHWVIIFVVLCSISSAWSVMSALEILVNALKSVSRGGFGVAFQPGLLIDWERPPESLETITSLLH